MKVSFVKAPIGGIIGLEMITFVEPLGFECVAGGLELEGHTCQIVDLRIDGIDKGIAKVRAFEPEIVGLQCNFTTERFRMLRLARRIKQEFPDVLVVAGGRRVARSTVVPQAGPGCDRDRRRHGTEVRYQKEGKFRTYLLLAAALATRKVTFSAIRKGMKLGMGRVLSTPDSFLRAHHESDERLAAAQELYTDLVGGERAGARSAALL